MVGKSKPDNIMSGIVIVPCRVGTGMGLFTAYMLCILAKRQSRLIKANFNLGEHIPFTYECLKAKLGGKVQW